MALVLSHNQEYSVFSLAAKRQVDRHEKVEITEAQAKLVGDTGVWTVTEVKPLEAESVEVEVEAESEPEAVEPDPKPKAVAPPVPQFVAPKPTPVLTGAAEDEDEDEDEEHYGDWDPDAE
jgi:hypothetical protein